MLAPKAMSEVARILASPSAKPFEKLGAASLVFDRAYGKAPQSVQLAISQKPVELASLTNEELAILASGGALPRLVELPTGETIDCQAVDVSPKGLPGGDTGSAVARKPWQRPKLSLIDPEATTEPV